MIGLDTNIVIRYLLQDDPTQSELAAQLIEQVCSAEEPGFIAIPVLVEMVWVLRRAYRFDRISIAEVIGLLLRVERVKVEGEEMVRLALFDFKEGFDFADALIGHRNRAAGCRTTATFDRRAAAMPAFSSVRSVIGTQPH
ncbi:type II toxin-antitoxin system VapC family toxin [Skermanella sp. TT6]|uniref:Ribonuclease VapC n=1 Tax=Skermanella cutis TaxID=2775420 RepID=A0ABX7B975_9PROT|nr:type II toxin-antitoxin system VapC family toxin [Skermanella sp. TT6]QQP90907.1 type II toxin-antitoxin system VapC family toxin [Skermanella sp. TT6]